MTASLWNRSRNVDSNRGSPRSYVGYFPGECSLNEILESDLLFSQKPRVKNWSFISKGQKSNQNKLEDNFIA